MTLIVDTGGLLSVLDGNQDDHGLFLEAVQTARGPLLVSPLILAELDHLVLDRYGREAELAAIEEVEAAYQVEQVEHEDLGRPGKGTRPARPLRRLDHLRPGRRLVCRAGRKV